MRDWGAIALIVCLLAGCDPGVKVASELPKVDAYKNDIAEADFEDWYPYDETDPPDGTEYSVRLTPLPSEMEGLPKRDAPAAADLEGLPQRNGSTGESTLAPPPAAVEPPAPEPVVPRAASEVAAVEASVTSAGLIRRTPRKVSVPADSRYAPPTGQVTPAPAQAASSTRSPEEVRQMLSRYRSGLKKGRTDEPQG